MPLETYLKQLLGENEKILLVTHQHWFRLVQEIFLEIVLALVIILVFTGIQLAVLPNPLFALGYFLVIIPLVSLARDVIIWYNHQYIVTNRRVIQIFGVINKNVTDSSLEKVNDVKMVQSFFGRIFNYGDVEILTASELGVNRFTKIGDPIRFKTVMLNAKGKLDSGESLRSAAATAAQREDIPALIERLGLMRDKGWVTEEEFQAKKADLLRRL